MWDIIDLFITLLEKEKKKTAFMYFLSHYICLMSTNLCIFSFNIFSYHFLDNLQIFKSHKKVKKIQLIGQ